MTNNRLEILYSTQHTIKQMLDAYLLSLRFTVTMYIHVITVSMYSAQTLTKSNCWHRRVSKGISRSVSAIIHPLKT